MLDCIKTFWREYVRIKEDKEAFFHSCSSLLNSKHYHRLYRSLSSGKGEILYYSSEDEKIYLKIESSTDRSMIVSTDSYYDIFLEIFVNKIYLLPPQISMKKFVVFDVGMNRGYASLYFADIENCEHVYGFELLSSTYKWACDNIELNPYLSSKIDTFNFGLWNKDDEVCIESDGIDGHTQVSTGTNDIVKKLIVKKASGVLSGLFQSLDNNLLKILKIDVEGAEYKIFADLYEQNIIKELDLIIGEYHEGIENLMTYLPDFRCSYKEDSVEKGIGSMVFVNKKYSNI